jgi:hypothetical protein
MATPITLSSVDPETVLREWLKPTAPYTAPAPLSDAPLETWTAVTTATGYVDAWSGDMPLLPGDHVSRELVRIVHISAGTLTFVPRR